MPTSRFVELIGVPERSYRRWQAKAKVDRPPKGGPWPQPARDAARELATKHALAHPAWGHRKVWAMVRHDGHRVSQATVLSTLRDDGLILPAEYQRERRRLARSVRRRSRRLRRARTRSGNWTSASSRPPRAGRGGSRDAGTGTRRWSTRSTCRRPRTSTMRLRRSNSPSPTTSPCSDAADRRVPDR